MLVYLVKVRLEVKLWNDYDAQVNLLSILSKGFAISMKARPRMKEV